MPKAKLEPGWVSHRAVADAIGVNSETLRNWVADGEWPEPIAVISKTWFYRRDQVESYLKTGAWPDGTRFKPGVGKGRVPAAV